ncbi:MAG: META domain-containing protein [Myxococcota bacterium]
MNRPWLFCAMMLTLVACKQSNPGAEPATENEAAATPTNSESDDAGSDASLEKFMDAEWVLSELEGAPAAKGAGGKSPTLTLHGTEKRASGFAGCNRFTGGYELGDEGTLRFPGVAMTMMACPDGMELEQSYSKALGATTSYEIEGNSLVLKAEDGRVVARFDLS